MKSSAAANKCLWGFLKRVVNLLITNEKLQKWCGVGAKIKNLVVKVLDLTLCTD